MPERSSIVTQYALLVGINFYPDTLRSLKGCVRDVQGMEEHLITRTGIDIRRLTASPTEPKSSRPAEDPEHLPTHDNVVSSLERIISHAVPGDLVYIHYSGHGTTIPPESEFLDCPNTSTGELALVLLQGTQGTNIKCLRGSELALRLGKMVEKQLIVTLVLDCCFSGSVIRDHDSVRFLPYDLLVDTAHPPAPWESLSSEIEAILSGVRSASMRQNWLVNPDGYCILAACGPTEEAKEIEVTGQYNGMLSYFLLRSFIKRGGVGGKQQRIYAYLCARFREKYPRQKPMLYGNKRLRFFEDASGGSDVTPIPVITIRNTSPKLQVGGAHGLCEGDQFILCTPGTAEDGSGAERGPVIAEVTNVGALLSDLKILDVESFPALSGLTAVARTRLSLRRFPIRLELHLACSAVWKAALEERASLDVQFIDDAEPGTSFSFYAAIIAKDVYEIRDEWNRAIPDLPASPYSLEENAAYVLDILEHLTRFKLAQSLTNTEPINDFRQSFDVRLVNTTTGTIRAPGCLRAQPFHPGCSHPECVMEAADNCVLELQVQNNENKLGHALHVHIYSLGSCWEIENLLQANHEAVPPRYSNQSPDYRQGTSGQWNKRIKMTVPEKLQRRGRRQCDDTIKVFLTIQQTSFTCLELPEIGELTERHGPAGSPKGVPDHLSEDWAALSFRVRTHVS
ncbi:hypothetical protein EKO27_g9297 [Xylaria grammica]|uniref:Peptidase C14 caspase domain-containing protein n=1 Tax=Xylaria grammica TaxID=363999 RepID=A0A439CUI4_9PEZI|nr:hypothetical protein EKO27_g9297 [Xylaria grammica]